MRIAINGFGRIGRSFFRIAFGNPDLEIVAINDLGNLENLAYLLKHDTVYGEYDKEIKTKAPESQNILVVNDKEILFFNEKNPRNLPWKKLDIDLIIEATGVFEDYNKAKTHIEAGAKKVIITAPAKGEEGKEGKTVLLGINDEDFDKFEIISNGSCTTNAVAPVLEVLKEKIGIKKAVLNTIHAYTSSQSLVDGPAGDDWLRGRAAAANIIPSTTGAAKTVSKAIKELEGKFDGIALRVPVACGSIADITFVSGKETTVEEINQILKQASKSEKWAKIIGVSEMPLVSTDIVKNPRPAIIDLSFTKVIDKDLVKVLIWYDNEWGYSWTLAEQLKRLKNLKI